MYLSNRVKAFVAFGKHLKSTHFEKEALFTKAQQQNNWFTTTTIQQAFDGIVSWLDEDALITWTNKYTFKENHHKTVGIVMAGNIPMVGFHDLLAVLICGYTAHLKLSSQDAVLIPQLCAELIEIEPWFKDKIIFAERLNDVDAVIATGSDNSARYFEYYFAKKPHIIRKNRTSVAVLRGNETAEDFKLLAKDIFTYYGLGCRNVSMLYAPKDYSFIPFYDAIEEFAYVGDHHKYKNNYDYNRSIYLIKSHPHLDNNFLLLTESADIVSPIGVLHFDFYENEEELATKLAVNEAKIQVIVSKDAQYPNSLDFGKAQTPKLWDYADGVDTLAFLTQL